MGLAKNDEKKERLETVLYNLLEGIRVCAVYLEPYLPDTSKEILRQINVDNKEEKFVLDSVYQVLEAKPIFMRLDIPKMLQTIEENK